MTSTRLMLFLLCVYVVILAASICERRWYRACYWAGAILIMIGVLGMGAERR